MFEKPNSKAEKKKKRGAKKLSLDQSKKLVHKRSGWVCENPECKNQANGGCHHIHKSGQGGSNQPHNLFDTCMYCHDKAEGKIKGIVGVLFMVDVLEKLKSQKNKYEVREKYFNGDKFIFQELLDYLLHTPGYFKNMKDY